MRTQLLLLIILLITSCGQENFQTSSTQESDNSVNVNQTEDKGNSTNEGEAYFYEDIVITENLVDETTGQNESETSNSEEMNESSENSEEATSENLIEVSATAYRTKAGELVVLGEDGKEIELGSIESSAESVLNEISFPNDSYEITLIGQNQMAVRPYLATNINGKISASQGNNVVMKVDSININDQTVNPERAENEEKFNHFVCGNIYIESGGDFNNIIIYDKLADSPYNDKSYQITFTVSSNLDMAGYQKYIEFYNYVEDGDQGCVYSEDSAYNDYTKSSRKLLNIIEYDFKW